MPLTPAELPVPEGPEIEENTITLVTCIRVRVNVVQTPCRILTSVDSDEPLQPPFKLGNPKWCSVSSLTFIEYSSD